jgi:multidrug efflux pump subunit AcrA (membrane-fusion protein)
MRKWIILVIAVAAVVGAWAYVRTLRYTPPWNMPKWDKITRGDIRVPITAAGLIEPHQRIEVKSKASGEVIRITVTEGDYVRAGDVLVELKRDDEQRNVDRNQAALDRVAGLLEQARIQIVKSEHDIELRRARVSELEAQSRMTRKELEKQQNMKADGQASEQDVVNAEARHEINMSQIEQARVNLKLAEETLKEAEANVRVQEASQRDAAKALEDAKERLADTVITSKVDGIVTEVKVTVGMLVQSGTASLTPGGTLLMTMADISRLKVITRVDEADYGDVLKISPIQALPQIEGLRAEAQRDDESQPQRSGTVKIMVDAFREDEFEGVISRVEPQGKLNVGAAIIQFNVHVDITDPRKHRLPLGTQAQVEFTVQNARGVLRAPAEAVKSFQNERGVWRRVPPRAGSGELFGKRFVPYRIGITDGEFTELLTPLGADALKDGDEVYTKLPVDEDQAGKR